MEDKCVGHYSTTKITAKVATTTFAKITLQDRGIKGTEIFRNNKLHLNMQN